MITFYFDGFRGLEQTFLPLLDVNFLVGENSTGKTSVLSAIQLLCSETFWYTGGLRNEHLNFGVFQEIATQGRRAFYLGYFEEGHEGKSRRALLAQFESQEDKPTLTVIRLLVDTFEEKLSSNGLESFTREAKSAEDIFRAWLTEQFDSAVQQPRKRQSKRQPHLIAPAYIQNMFTSDVFPGLDSAVWMAPVRAKPRRIYDPVEPAYSPEGHHTPYLLRRMLKSLESPQRTILQTFGRDSGIFKDVHIHQFGNDDLSPLSVDVDLGSLRTSIFNVGYGVSQALPILAEIIARSEETSFLIQQPELHLHPKAQAALGNLFFDMSRAPHQKQFLLETHSDFIMDRFCLCMRKATDAGQQVPSAQVLFFERKGDKNVITPIEISPRGEYPEDQPAEFRDFFLQEELRILGF